MGRTASRKTKKDSPATEPASSSTAIPQTPDENEDEETAASLSSVLEGLHVGLADWLMYSATQEQRATVVRASNMVRDSPTPQNEAKATEILYRVIGDAGIFGQLYRHHAKNPLDLLRVLTSKTVQNYPEVLSGLAGRNGDEAIPAPPANSTLAGADSQPSGAPCSCSRCKGRQRFSEDDEPEGFFCAADLILSQRDEIKLVKAYNAQFGRRASKPPPSRCQKLLAKARTRRADDGRASHVETSLCFFGMRKPFSSTPLHKLSPSESHVGALCPQAPDACADASC